MTNGCIAFLKLLSYHYTPEKVRREYLDMYKGVQLGILHTTRFDESSDLSKTYLGKTDMTRATKIKAEETFAISE